MKLLIVGLGSMGKRRARLAKGIDASIELCGVDLSEERRTSEEVRRLGIDAYPDIPTAVAARHPDAALVCTAPITHSGIIGQLLDEGLPVFTELNLVSDGYTENMAKAKAKGLPLFLSRTMLYRGETQYIKQQVAEFKKPVNYIYHIGQYLPDWHPWENYKNFFVGDKRTSGVREIFGIDLPWLLDAFGPVKSVYVEKDKLSDLELPYPDSWFVTTKTAPRAFWPPTWSAPRPCATLSASVRACTCSGRVAPPVCTALTTPPARRTRCAPTRPWSTTAGTVTTSWKTPTWTS